MKKSKLFLYFMTRNVLAIAISGSVVIPASAQRARLTPPEGANWQAHAERYLVNLDGRPFDAKRDTRHIRCVKMNNYPCLKQNKANWPHTPGAEGLDGAHDGSDGENGHAIFDHPKWSIVADLRWFERRTNGGRRTMSALELAEIYMPWCDTLGSMATKADASGQLWGKTCTNRIRAPDGFAGPLCKKPESGDASPAQRQACNYPPSAARNWTKGLGVDIEEKLTLFDNAGRPTPLMIQMIGNVVTNENGRYRPREILLEEARAVFVPVAQ